MRRSAPPPISPTTPPMKRLFALILLPLAVAARAAAAAPAAVVPDVRTQVYLPTEVDQQPKLMFSRRPIYPAALQGQHVAGEVVVECVVDLDGVVRDPVVKSSTRPEFDLPALQCVVTWKFRPGRKGRDKVNVRLELTVKFEPKR